MRILNEDSRRTRIEFSDREIQLIEAALDSVTDGTDHADDMMPLFTNFNDLCDELDLETVGTNGIED